MPNPSLFRQSSLFLLPPPRQLPQDLLFLSYYFVVWWFLRDICSRVFPALARQLGVTKENKIDRFTEQAYTAVYSSISTVAGIYVMYHLPTNWYNTAAFFERESRRRARRDGEKRGSRADPLFLRSLLADYETQYQMPGHLKAYYLMQR